jgi:hypothetical protein
LLPKGHRDPNSKHFGSTSIDDVGITIKSPALLTRAHGHWTMLARLQRLGPWLFCLFLVAQIGGVTPLIYVDVLHEYGHVDAAEITAVSEANQAQPHQHDPGVHDEHDQCCALHHGLIGTLPHAAAQVEKIGVQSILALAPTVLVSATPARLDRPPRA